MVGARRVLLVAGVVGAALAGPVLPAGPVLSAGRTSAGLPDAAVVAQAIDTCSAKLNPEIDVGYERVAARCPDLVRRLNGSWSVWLPADWRRPGNDLSVAGLRELRELLANAPVVGNRVPRVGSLPGVLAELVQEDSEHNSWWTRTRAWLRGFFAGGAVDENPNWLTADDELSESVLEGISYVALLLVVLLAVAIVAHELRVSGVLGRARARRRSVVASSDAEGVVWEDAPLQERPRLLLELIVARRGGGVARGLTLRELVVDHPELRELATVSEQVRFAATMPSTAAIDAALARGRALIP